MKIKQEVNDLIKRSFDSHLRLAVTGLSRAGKTAFITSLVNQLLNASTQDNLPLLEASQKKRLLGAKRIPQANLMVPRFDYELAMAQLHNSPPQWPEPTRDVSEIRLAIRFQVQTGAKRLFKKTSTLYLDIVDYPGEWLLDLPLLDMSFEQWSAQQMKWLNSTHSSSNHSQRATLAQTWRQAMQALDLNASADEEQVLAISQAYTDYLHACKQDGLHWVQPGRFVLPGELAGAPVLQFFPITVPADSDVKKGSNYAMLRERFNQYKKKIVKTFYQEHFSTFDRQIVLVDCLQPLNAGYDAFMDMSGAIDQLMQSFKYGRSSLLNRLFSPKIDKVLFAATKADHVTPDQQANLLSLLQQMVKPAWQQVAYEGIEMDCLSIASIQATTPGYANIDHVSKNNSKADTNKIQAIKGTRLNGEHLTLFPGEVPAKLPQKDYWQNNSFDFYEFRPQVSTHEQALPHIRLDRALQFLLGDKLR